MGLVRRLSSTRDAFRDVSSAKLPAKDAKGAFEGKEVSEEGEEEPHGPSRASERDVRFARVAELTGVHRSVCLSGKVLAFSIAKKVAALAIGYVRVQESEDGCPSRRSFVVRSTDGVARSFCPFPCTARQRSRRIDIWVPQVVSKVQRTVPVLDEQQRDAREGERFCEISTALPNKVQRHVEEYGWQEQLWHYPREDHHELTA